MKRSLEQLRSQVWNDHASAVKELKRNGFSVRGQDYELRESDAGLWQIMELEDADEATPRVQQLPMRPARGTKFSPQAKPEPSPAKQPKAAAKAKAKAPPATAAKPEPEPEPPAAAAPPRNDLSALPTEDGPYEVVLREDEMEHYPAHSTNATALRLAKQLNGKVHIRNRHGVIVRTIDVALIAPASKPARAPGGGSPVGRKRDPSAGPNPMVAEVIRLARRANGVTREQLRAVSSKQQPWTAIIKDAADRYGYVYRTSEAPADSKSRTVYHLDDKPTQ